MLDVKLADTRKPHLVVDGAAQIGGAGGLGTQSVERYHGSLQLAGTAFADLMFLFTPMDHFRAHGRSFYGVIGYHLLSQRPCAIDYATQQQPFW